MATRSHTLSRRRPTRKRKVIRSSPGADLWVKVQAKGQVTIDQRVRSDLGVAPGDEVAWVRNGQGRWELWKAEELERAFDEAAVGFADWQANVKKGYAPKPAKR